MAASQTPLPPPRYVRGDNIAEEWVSATLHQYQGFWYDPRLLPGVLDCQKNFQAQDTDIILVTNPKSGTTWVKAILYALLNRTTYSCTENHPLLSYNPHELVSFMEHNYYVEERAYLPSDLTLPRLISTHLPYVSLPQCVKSSGCKIIYLCRNPKDSFISGWHFTNNLGLEHTGSNTLEDTFERFCKGVVPYGPYWDHVLDYWKESLKNPERLLFLKYEEMKEDPSFHLRRIAEFSGCAFSQEEEERLVVDEISKFCSFDNLSNLEVNKSGKTSVGVENRVFFRRGKVGDSENYLTAEMIEKLNQITEQKLGKFGLKF